MSPYPLIARWLIKGILHNRDQILSECILWLPAIDSDRSKTRGERSRTLFDSVRITSETPRVFRNDLAEGLRDGVSLFLILDWH
jgi:hypothetical protein